MKNLLLLIATLCVLTAKSQTNVYHQLPDSNATWNVNMSQAMCFMWGFSTEDYSITLSGDTIIDNLAYKKLTTPFVEFTFTGGCNQINFPGYQGAIREDVANRKVYYVPPSQSTEQLLYDFNMQVGDTVKGYLESFDYPGDIVTEIDSVLVGDNYRKRWLVNQCYGIYFIEGIGSTFGLLQPSPGCATDMDYYSISCFTQNGQTQYPDPSSECQLITSIKNIDIISAVRVFPNPSSGFLTIDISNSENFVQIRLTNMVGSVVYQKEIVDQHIIYIPALPGGAYILTLLDKEKRTLNRKIVSCP